jgi:uracil-DNA glycosylase family 4
VNLGQRSKPNWCYQNCGYHGGTGFAPVDSVEKLSRAKVCLILEALGSWEAFYSRPLSGNTGKMFFNQFVEPLGYSREDCLIDNALRCHANENKYPTGKQRIEAESKCRFWDAAIDVFDPNVIAVTYHPASLFEEKQRHRLIRESVKRAFYWYEQGYRPVLLFGSHARDVFAPWLQGDLKRWCNSWTPIKWEPRGKRDSLVLIDEFFRPGSSASAAPSDQEVRDFFYNEQGDAEAAAASETANGTAGNEASEIQLGPLL